MIKVSYTRILRNRKAMTLAEILLVVAIFSVITIAIYNSLSSGIKVWNKSRELLVEEDIVIFFDKLSMDLRNVYIHSKIKAKGNEHRLSFPSIVIIRSKDGKEISEQLGKVEYYYDPPTDAIYRRQAGYGEALAEVFSSPQALVKGVNGFKLSYFYPAEEGENYSAEAMDDIPSRIEVEVKTGEWPNERVLKKRISVPLNQ
ncbi:MAG: prepilin-type N-terminal cleavage/methylation domain-containing protein [Candidatus Omnitrophica bacterium]|nr:prepilin-type N-terminal cleavage/methylation domain-containing protein [Candidatus Omnitrophota bacterium]